MPDVFSDKKKQQNTSYEAQLAELYEQIGRLKVENDFLKKRVMCSMADRLDWVEPHHPCTISRVSDMRCAGLMNKLSLRSVAPGPHTSKPHLEHKVYPYLLQDIEVVQPCQVFSTDITYGAPSL